MLHKKGVHKCAQKRPNTANVYFCMNPWISGRMCSPERVYILNSCKSSVAYAKGEYLANMQKTWFYTQRHFLGRPGIEQNFKIWGKVAEGLY